MQLPVGIAEQVIEIRHWVATEMTRQQTPVS